MKLAAFSILLVVLFAWPVAAASPTQPWSDFVETLSPAGAEQALKPFDDRDRRRSRYTPGTRGGLPLSDMDAATRAASFAFVGSVLSDHGREMVEAIIEREAVLGRMEGRPEYRDPDLYYLAVFGSPDDGRWGLRFEGHHLSVNVTLTGDDFVSVLPLSLGANPEKLPDTGEVLLTPVVDKAAIAAAEQTPGTLRPLLEALLSIFPADIASRTVTEVETALADGTRHATRGGFEFSGGDVSLAISGIHRNHIHITLESDRADFGRRS